MGAGPRCVARSRAGVSVRLERVTASPEDTRWGDRVPWYLRYGTVTLSGKVDLWLELVGQRLERLFLFNEAGVLNEPHFGSSLETETFRRFQFTWGMPLGSQLKKYFLPDEVRRQAQSDASADPEERRAAQLAHEKRMRATSRGGDPKTNTEEFLAQIEAGKTRLARTQEHWAKRVNERVSTLEAIFRNLGTYGTNAPTILALVADIRMISAASQVPLDVRGSSPPLIYPLEEPLLQREVVEPLLTRLASRWPDRARELVAVYHDVLSGKPLDEVFSSAFKTVEEVARAVTGEASFDFSDGDLKRCFPSLHPTIRAGIAKLRAHRGDSASHGRKAPHPSEIRYLLFQICNLALLLLDISPGS